MVELENKTNLYNSIICKGNQTGALIIYNTD